MAKLKIILAISLFGFVSTHAENKIRDNGFQLVGITNPKIGAKLGYKVQYIDEAHCTVENLEAFLKKAGYKEENYRGVGDYWIKKDDDGTEHVAILPAIYSATIESWKREAPRMSEAWYYQLAEEFVQSSKLNPMKHFSVFFVSNNHKNLVADWFDGIKNAFLRVVKKYTDWACMYCYTGTPEVSSQVEVASSQSPWSRFLNCLSEEKLALGLTSLGALLLAASHYYSR